MLMWGKKPLKNYGVHMTELILSILRHILRSEQIIKVYIFYIYAKYVELNIFMYESLRKKIKKKKQIFLKLIPL